MTDPAGDVPGCLGGSVLDGQGEQRRAGEPTAGKQGQQHAGQPGRGQRAEERRQPARGEDRVGGQTCRQQGCCHGRG
jgi:hypothetical protein